jgi:hypothetical protein
MLVVSGIVAQRVERYKAVLLTARVSNLSQHLMQAQALPTGRDIAILPVDDTLTRTTITSHACDRIVERLLALARSAHVHIALLENS